MHNMVKNGAAGLIAAFAAAALLVAPAADTRAQTKEPIKIGFGMSLTGPLAPNGKSSLLGDEDLGGRRQCQGRTHRAAGEARPLR